MRTNSKLSRTAKLTVACLIIAAMGLVTQILSGASYPVVSPGLFILLVPGWLYCIWQMAMGSGSRHIAGIFLTLGLFTSVASQRLFTPNSIGDTIGLWVQSPAVVGAIIAGLTTAIENYKKVHPSADKNAAS